MLTIHSRIVYDDLDTTSIRHTFVTNTNSILRHG